MMADIKNGPKQLLEEHLGRPLTPTEQAFANKYGQAQANAFFILPKIPAQACPNAMPSGNNKYYRKEVTFIRSGAVKFGKNGMYSDDPAYAVAHRRSTNYRQCGMAVLTGAGMGQMSNILKAAGKKYITQQQFKQSLTGGPEQEQSPFNGAIADAYLGRAFAMGFQGTDFENTTRKLFCQCLDKYLDHQSGK